MSDELKPCPFCACDQLKISPNIHTGLLRVQCEGCWATSVTSNNRANLIAAWNRRASSPPERKEALAAARRMLEPIEPDGSYAVDGFFKDAALVASAMLAASKETER